MPNKSSNRSSSLTTFLFTFYLLSASQTSFAEDVQKYFSDAKLCPGSILCWSWEKISEEVKKHNDLKTVPLANCGIYGSSVCTPKNSPIGSKTENAASPSARTDSHSPTKKSSEPQKTHSDTQPGLSQSAAESSAHDTLTEGSQKSHEEAEAAKKRAEYEREVAVNERSLAKYIANDYDVVSSFISTSLSKPEPNRIAMVRRYLLKNTKPLAQFTQIYSLLELLTNRDVYEKGEFYVKRLASASLEHFDLGESLMSQSVLLASAESKMAALSEAAKYRASNVASVNSELTSEEKRESKEAKSEEQTAPGTSELTSPAPVPTAKILESGKNISKDAPSAAANSKKPPSKSLSDRLRDSLTASLNSGDARRSSISSPAQVLGSRASEPTLNPVASTAASAPFQFEDEVTDRKTQAAFAMNSDQTRSEVKKLLESLNGSVEPDGPFLGSPEVSIFDRVRACTLKAQKQKRL